MKINEIILRPILTEKAVNLAKESVYTFEVNLKSNKHQIKRAVEELFSVEVGEINTTIRKGKVRKVGNKRQEKKGSDSKVAYVKVLKGDISLFPKT